MRDGAVNCPAGGAWSAGAVPVFPGTKVGGLLGLPCSDGCNKSPLALPFAFGSADCALPRVGTSATIAMAAKIARPVTLSGRQRRGTCDLLAPKRPVRVIARQRATRRPARAAGRQTAG